ncbi:uncharacterized protein EV154DRAFT_516617 [Mucor mucedo]|uniref:uncharacterized protein n=1 Tax=Mucor mucedo TaxID=29922 RepID=UPI002220E477|nr:uncharacterized protein EV154DRAFT_516617 [Mucor mucedo]KAI7888716.1 hypothetical protein EV154DRAFT_516617 [Mucor mucedo]
MFNFNKKEGNDYDDRNQLIDRMPEEMYIIPIHDVPVTLDNKPRRYCRILANVTLILGMALVVISALFKLQSRVYISQAIEAECPAICVTTCYRFMPFPTSCESKSACDDQCLSAGISKALTYSVLFTVFVLIGGLLVLVQVVQSCISYCFYDYIDFKNKQTGQKC